MKKRFVSSILAFSVLTLFTISGCKKSAESETDYTSNFSVQTDDQTFFSAEDDAVSNEVNTVLEVDSTFAGRVENTVCHTTITHSSTSTSKILTITYNGLDCSGNRNRTGVVVLTLPKEKRWKEAGAQLSITYNNFSITRVSDTKTIVLNGTKTVTNVTGGELKNLPTLKAITHNITSSDLSITFSDGTKRSWQIVKQRVFTFNNGVVISTQGMHTDGTTNNIAEWGINRLGETFSTQIVEPVVLRQDCDFRIVSGKIAYTKLERPVTITYGLNAAGVATTCPGTGHYYYKIEWTTIKNIAHSVIHSY